MPRRKTQREAEWRLKYGYAVESEATVECCECGEVLLGDGPILEIVCLDCWSRQDPLEELLDIAEDSNEQQRRTTQQDGNRPS
jgi:hypothetical protein